jgi:PAS domain S-box-containing protein
MTAGLVVGLLLIVGAGVASVLSLYARGQAGGWVSHTLLVRQLLTAVHTRMHEAEAAQRGYIITGDDDYLHAFNEAQQQIGPDLERLERLTAAKPQQQDRLKLVRSLARSRLERLNDGVERRRTGGFEAAALIVRTGRGKAVMERIRAALAELDQEESRLQAEREAVARQRERWLVASTLGGSGLGVVLVVLTSVHAWRSRRATAAAYEQLRTSELQLRASEIRYRTLFESIDEGFCIIQMIFDEHDKPSDYRFLEISPSFERQTGLVDARGKTMRELAPRHEEHWFETYGAIALTGQPARFQNRAEQLRRWYDVYAFRFGRPEDRQVAVLFNDITERKRTEESLEAANRELNDFATVVSHDLKSPLRAVSTLARWIQSDYADKLDAEARENLAEMVRRVGRMDRMIDELLAYSRLGRVEEKRETVALDNLVAEVVHDLALSTRVHVRIAPSLPVVCGEPVRLRQLFQNLIGNAVKHADKPETQVCIEWADAGSFWQFSVADNGPGIDERHFERIFKVFQTLAPKDATDSTGVGLALVKRITERAGGRVWVESRPGPGSTFYFTWPKADAAELVATSSGLEAMDGEQP